MKPLAAWSLVAAALLAGWFGYGWRGIVLALTVIVFWLLLQLSRTLRVMRKAAGAPVGHVESAVMLHSKLREGMTLAQILALTGSLGERAPSTDDGAVEEWRWCDAGGATVNVRMSDGRLLGWKLDRPEAGS
jgi:hypothetical protein